MFATKLNTFSNSEPLSVNEMQIVAECFSSAVDVAMSRVPKGETLIVVTNFCYKYLTSLTHSVVFTPASATEIRDIVFKDTVVRDFITDVTVTFYTMWAEAGIKNTKLSYTLSVAFTEEKNDFSLIPKELASRSNDTEQTFAFLSNNKWLMIIALFLVFTKQENLSVKK